MRPLAVSGPSTLDRPDRLGALVRHLPFAVDDFEAVREAYARWRTCGDDDDLRTVQLWAYCYVVWYAFGKLARDASAQAADLDWVVERACRRIFRSLGGVRDPERFPQFVSVVCKNVVASYRERRQPTAELPDVAAPAAGAEVDPIDRPLVREAVARAIAALPPALGDVARMRLLDRRGYAEIAEATGHPLATARTYFSKAIRKLREDPGLRAVYLGEAPHEADLADPPGDGDEKTERQKVRSSTPRGLSPRPPDP